MILYAKNATPIIMRIKPIIHKILLTIGSIGTYFPTTYRIIPTISTANDSTKPNIFCF